LDEKAKIVSSHTTPSKAAGRSGIFGQALGKRYTAENLKYHKGQLFSGLKF
jgi:hypothetical protein